MKQEERDQLLGRIDERTRNIWSLTEKQEKHLGDLNDKILEHAVGIGKNKGSIKRVWWIIGGCFTALVLGIGIAISTLPWWGVK